MLEPVHSAQDALCHVLKTKFLSRPTEPASVKQFAEWAESVGFSCDVEAGLIKNLH